MTSQTTLDEMGRWITEWLPKLLAEHDVPAAAVAVGLGDEVVDAAAGVLNLSTGVEATTDSVFQIGSITKVWTATLVMQLVDEGLLDLDERVRNYLPGFTIADDAAADAITVRELLCHTAGFEGDNFTDTGRGDDAVEKFVALLDDVPQLYPPGELFSYNNAGYSVLGRIVEVLRGTSYDDCLAERLFTPLALASAAAGPWEAIMHRAAMGHVKHDPESAQVPAPFWAMARSNGPAGSMLSMTARDLLAFARMHVDHGAAAGGTQVLEAASVEAMQTKQVTLPDLRVLGTGWGLGWELFENVGTPMIGHDGNTVGQSSFLRVLPESGLAVVLLTNGGDPYGLFHAVVGPILEKLAGVTLAPHPTPPADPEPIEDADRYLGTYGNRTISISVSQDEAGRVWSEIRPIDTPDPDTQVQRSELVSLAPDVLIPVEPMSGLHIPHAFIGEDGDGRARWVHIGRALPRLSEAPTV